MEKVNLPIDPEIGQEIIKNTENGYVITGCDVIKGWKGAQNTYYVSLEFPTKRPMNFTDRQIKMIVDLDKLYVILNNRIRIPKGSVADLLDDIVDAFGVKEFSAAVPAREISNTSTPKEKFKDGDAENAEKNEPFKFIKPVIAAHSTDPSKPTLADLVNVIINTHKKLGLSGKALADRCLTDVMDMKDPVTNTSLASDVQLAMQAYLNYELSKV